MQQPELVRGWSIDQPIFLGLRLETSIERESGEESTVQRSSEQRDC
jgi:hypothetical protein